jgi:phage terminase Nu1 subunit (DNA packaging protein)
MFATRPPPQNGEVQAPRPPKRTAKTILKAAIALGVDERTVKLWFVRGAPKCRGAYDLEAIERWAAANGCHRRDKGDLTDQLKRAELAKTTQQGRIAQMKADIMEGRLVDREEVKLRAGEFGARVRQRLEAFPSEVLMQMPLEVRQDVKLELERLVENILKEMSMWTFIHEKQQ